MHQQIQQVQQRINSVNQMISQLRQSEENTRQRLMQLAQDEAYVAQQLQRVQQMCQESINGLQSISGSFGQQTLGSGYLQSPLYGQGISAGSTISGISQTQTQGSSPLFDPTTMNPQTYQNTMQFMGGQGISNVGVSGSQGVSGMGMSSGVGQIMGTNASLSDISTMSPSTYQASREQLGKGYSSLGQIGQQSGISQSNKYI